MILTPKNWKSFQHYRDRAPAWIKLHKALLDDYEFSCLPVASKALAPLLWLLASEYEDGKIDAKMDKIAFRLHLTISDLSDALRPLVERGFFDASEPIAERKQDAIPEREKEREKEHAASAAHSDPEVELFRRGREVLGKESGGLISKLLAAKQKSIPLARAAIEQASAKENPREYIGAVIRGPKAANEPNWLDGIPGVL